jgi:glycosyltransferase involved in cell wall biosynthesis
MSNLPNLLIVSQVIPQSVNAGSIQLLRLLKDYPAEKLSVFGTPPSSDAELLDCDYQSFRLALERLHFTRLSKFTRSLRVYKMLPRLSVNSIRRNLRGFQADVVLTIMQEQPYFDLAYRFARAESLPLALIIHDLPELFEKVYGWAEKRQLKRNAEIYAYASKRLCVSPEMCAHLENVYGAKGDVLYPNRADEIIARPPAEARNLKERGILTLGYLGAVAYGRGAQLLRMIPALREAGARLRIYSADHLESDAQDVITNCGYTPAGEIWPRIKRECDALILTQLWPDNAKFQLFYHTSFPSKLSEYMALGIPVLMIGPEYASSILWGLRNEDAALVVTEDEHAAWVAALKRLKESSSLREKLSAQAVIAASRDFDPGVIVRSFTNHMREAAAEKKLKAGLPIHGYAGVETS